MAKSYLYLATPNPDFIPRETLKKQFVQRGKITKAYKEYIDEQADKMMMMKIGETCNINSRAQGLYKSERARVIQIFEFEGTKTDRLFLESYVRLKAENSHGFNTKHKGLDHFSCVNINFMKAINNSFMTWCEEGYALLKSIKKGT